MSSVEITEIDVSENRITITFDPASIGHFFSKTQFVCEYDIPVSETPEGIAVIPCISTLAPIAWANDLTVRTPELDEEYRQALQSFQDTLDEFYPEIGFGNVPAVITNSKSYNTKQTDSCGVLFSGGLDSLVSYIRHHDENPTLIHIHKYPDRSKKDLLQNQISKFADSEEKNVNFINSDMYRVVNYGTLNLVYKGKLGGSWWARVQHGAAYLSSTAPLAYSKGLSSMYIASSHGEQYQIPFGSRPEIDNNIRWSGTRCFHDGYSLTRQNKWNIASEYLTEQEITNTIRSCTGPGNNCSECFMCARNIFAMPLVGLNPNNYGYDVNHNTFELILDNIQSGRWRFDENNEFYWTEIQENIPTDPSKSEYEIVRQWSTQYKRLQNLNITVNRESNDMPIQVQAFRRIYQSSPKLALFLRQLYTSIR